MSTRDKIGKALDEISEQSYLKMKENPLLEVSLNTIPLIGPLLINFIKSNETRFLQRRFLKLYEYLNEEINNIQDQKIDKSFIETEEFYDILRKVYEYTAKTRDNAKIKLYSRILVRISMLNNAFFRYTAEDFLLILIDLSPTDLMIAKKIYQQQKGTPIEIKDINQNELKIVKESGWDTIPSILGVNQTEFELSILKLVRAGLIKQVSGTYVNYIGDAYRITRVFRMLMKLIETLD